MKRKKAKLLKKKQANLDAVRVKSYQFRVVLLNKYAGSEQDEDNIEVMKKTASRQIWEAAIEVVVKPPKQTVGKLSQVAIGLIKK